MLSRLLVLSLPLVAAVAALGSARPATPPMQPMFEQPRGALRLVLAPDGNEARYRVREQLLGMEFPNDAIGKTDKLEGSLNIAADGKIAEGSKFVVDLSTLASDQSMRDNYIRNNTLETAQFPKAEFVLVSAKGLPTRVPTAGDVSFELTGNLTLHGVTKPATWIVKGKMAANGETTGTATTAFKFGDFNMTIPRVRRVMSVTDSITLEYDFRLIPQPAGSLK